MERTEQGDERKRMLFGRMERVQSRGKWLVAPRNGFQVISFSCPTSHSHPFSHKESQVFPCSARSVGCFPWIFIL